MVGGLDGGVGAKNGAMEEEFRAAVVGGGLAGISAARLLSSRFGKESVVILEAASRLGGRIRNVHGLAPWPVELGAEFLHGSINSSVKSIADEMGCVLRELKFHYYYIGHERRLYSSKEADEHPDIQLVHEIFSTLSQDISRVADISMTEYLRSKGVNDTVMQLAEAVYGNDFGCSLDKLGVHECIQEAQHWTYGDTYLILDRPLLSVVAYMSKDLSVHFPSLHSSFVKSHSQPCNAKKSSEHHSRFRMVEVTFKVRLDWVVDKVERLPDNKLRLYACDGRTVKADNVILSVPVISAREVLQFLSSSRLQTVLQHEAITFNPPLPDWKLQAARAIGMSNALKVIFSFCHPFWPEGLFDVVCLGCFLPEVWITEYPRPQDTEQGNWSSRQPLGQHVVVGFVAGKAADAISQLSETEVFKRGLAQLDEMFGKRQASSLARCGPEGTSGSIDVRTVPQEDNLRCEEQKDAGHHGSTHFPQSEESQKFVTKSDVLRGSSRNSDAHTCETNPASFHFQGGMIVNWAQQSYIRGGYSHPSVNAQGARAALARPVDRIFFAGEATHHGVNPCLQAAIDTGQTAAYQVIRASMKSSWKSGRYLEPDSEFVTAGLGCLTSAL